MKTIFLTFPDKQTADSLLFRTEYDETLPIYSNTDVVGAIYKPTGEKVQDEDGDWQDVMADVGGFHVNLAADTCPEELQQYEVFPVTPNRVFGGLE